MNKKLVLTLSLFMLLSFLLYVRSNPVELKASNGYTVHNVDTGLNYKTIQAAINAPETLEGHTIFVEKETYRENINVNKDGLTLIGEDRESTVIDGDGATAVMHITARNVTVKGFTVQNGQRGVYVDQSSGVTIVNNTATNVSSNGIELAYSYGNNITGNIIINSHGGIWIGYSSNNILKNNKIINNEYNFMVYGRLPSEYIQDIDTSNTVNDKPIYYLINESDIIITPSLFPNIGYLALIRSNNVTIRNLHISNNWQGLLFAWTNNSQIINVNVSNNGYGMYLYKSTANSVSENIMTHNLWHGIELIVSSSNILTNNIIADNGYHGIWLATAHRNIIRKNTVTENSGAAMCILDSSSNAIYHNNFIHNTWQIIVNFYRSENSWDNGYPLGGNYWDDYTGVDSNYDGIGDSFHVIDKDNIDRCPLVGMFYSFNALEYHVNVISNSTVRNFKYFESNSTIKIYVSGEEGFGFCRASIPHVLMDVSNLSVVIDNGLTTLFYPNYTLYDNGTHRWIYFAYEHSTHEVDIIPEFASFLILSLFMIAVSLMVASYRIDHTSSPKLQQK